jgi:hypothetical protein
VDATDETDPIEHLTAKYNVLGLPTVLLTRLQTARSGRRALSGRTGLGASPASFRPPTCSSA